MGKRQINVLFYSVFFILSAAISLCGCSAITVPDPSEIVRHPLGTETIKIGMTKHEVESIWGKPSNIEPVEDSGKWSGAREVWTYEANYSTIPVDAGYLSKTKKLYFDGENLTEISD